MKLVVLSGAQAGREITAGPAPMTVGRDPASDLALSDARVSWHHARFTALPDGRAILEDLESTNGTFVNGQRVRDRTFVSGGESITFGDTQLNTVASAMPAAADPPTPLVAPGPPPQQPPPVQQPPVQQPFPQQIPLPGQAYAPRPVQSPSVIQRIGLERSVKRANLIAIGALIVSVVVILAVVGVYVLTPRPGTPTSVAAAAEPSTVLVVANRKGQRAGNGTGWVYDSEHGYLVTNAHVVNAAETLQIGVNTMRDADIVGVAPCEDLAVLHVADTGGLRTLPLGSQSEVSLGDTSVALGFPINATPTDDLQVTVGNVSAVQVTLDASQAPSIPSYPNVVQTTTPINPGNSGGPLIDLFGKLIGVNSAQSVFQATNYAIGVDRVKQIAPTLAEGHSLMWTGLGFGLYITEDSLSDPDTVAGLTQSALPRETGIYVDHLVGGTQDPGFTLPALMVKANGKELNGTLSNYCSAISSGSQTSVPVTVIQAVTGQQVDVEMSYR